MPNLPLSTRRRLARGISRRVIPAWRGRSFLGLGSRKQRTTALAGANNDITLIARDPANTSNQTSSLSDAIEVTVCP